MTRQAASRTAAALVALSIAAPASAHHSFAMYDRTRSLTLTGKLSRFIPGANHAQLIFELVDANGDRLVGDDGNPVTWGVETGPAAQIAEQGITVRSFPIGTVITVTLNPLRDGRPFGALAGPVISCGMALPDGGCTAATGESFGDASVRPEQTEIWEPVPVTVASGPGAALTPPPSDAIVLFDGTSLDEWVDTRDGSPAGWTLADGLMKVDKSAGNIETRRRFGSFELHLEWRIPATITGTGQARGNSGLFLASTGPADAGYELQILDSYGNSTYVNGMAGSVYKQSIPLANPSRPPGEWQSYDVVWTAPVFDADGSLRSPARITAFFNGVLVQDDFELPGETVYIGRPRYRAHGDSPIKLQAHADPSPPIDFRNIWVRPLP